MMIKRFGHNHSYRLIQGSALLQESYIKLIGENSGQKGTILITDPPYCRLIRRRKFGDERESSSSSRIRKLKDDESTIRFENMAHYSQFTNEWIAMALQLGLESYSDLIIWTNFLGRTSIIDGGFSFAFSRCG